ncbi:transposase [Paracoccus cavernae]|uniref:transposase n=1 Tax=Paracoccus cavernae TaxID=1571207 RepID=UPI0035F4529E
MARRQGWASGPTAGVLRCCDTVLPDGEGVVWLPLRQTIGMVSSILEMAKLAWPVPDFSTLSRRQKSISVGISSRRAPGPLKLLVDSTGITPAQKLKMAA